LLLALAQPPLPLTGECLLYPLRLVVSIEMPQQQQQQQQQHQQQQQQQQSAGCV
jgi:hypothetical protein